MPQKNQDKKTAKGFRQQVKQLFDWAESLGDYRPGKPYLKDVNGVLALHLDAMSVQSEMSLDEPNKLILSYTRAMMSFLLLDPSPHSIAMIGLGGGSLAKYCYRHLPHTVISVVEINPDVIALRNEFAIPRDDERFQILLGDGATFVSDTETHFDVLMLDGFDATGLPSSLSSQQFYDDCYATLTETGILVVNLWGGYPHYDEYLARIQRSFSGRVVVIIADDSPNNIVFACKDSKFKPTPALIRHHANLLGAQHSLNFQAKANKLVAALEMYR